MKSCIKRLAGVLIVIASVMWIISCPAEPEIKYVDKAYCASVTFTSEDLGEGKLQITMETATEGAVIHFTTDGSTPTTSSPLYTVPVTLIKDAMLKAVAVKPGMENSPVSWAMVSIVEKTVDNPNPPEEIWVELTDISDFDGNWVCVLVEMTMYYESLEGEYTLAQEENSVYKGGMKEIVKYTYSSAEKTLTKGFEDAITLSKVDDSPFDDKEKAYFKKMQELDDDFYREITDKTFFMNTGIIWYEPIPDITTISQLKKALDFSDESKLSINSSKTSIRVTFSDDPESETKTFILTKQN